MKNKKKETKKQEKYMNLTGEFLTLINEYYLINKNIKNLEDSKKELREIIINHMQSEKMEKARSQLYSVSLKTVEPKPKLSEKKLHEEMIARGLESLWKNCLYTPESYPKLTVNLRKGGENIF